MSQSGSFGDLDMDGDLELVTGGAGISFANNLLFDGLRADFDHLLMAWHAPHRWATTTVITSITTPAEAPADDPVVDHYHSSGKAVVELGWKVLDPAPGRGAKASKRKRGESEPPPPRTPSWGSAPRRT